jgi:hypothetical protein
VQNQEWARFQIAEKQRQPQTTDPQWNHQVKEMQVKG